jgi:hypothetical protein
MPRVSLPSSIKNLKTFEVLLTQTTEAHLRSHCETFFANFEATREKYMSRISDAVGIFLDGNPYTEKDWKKREPTRHYKDLITWFGEDEADVQEYLSFQFFLSDLNLLSKNFQWEELEDMKYEVERFMTHMYSGQKDLAQLEEMRFTQAKKQFQEENKEWIEEQKMIKIHKSSHHTGYRLRIKQEEGENIDQHLACIYCKDDYDKEMASVQRTRDYEARQRELHPEHYIIKNLTKTIDQQVPYVRPPEQSCEDCGFKTYYTSAFEAHKQESQHKRALQLKEWYCKDCDSQSRTKIEYDNHIQTSKHKKRVGELETVEYVCEKCNYKTLLKHLYDQHCTTKKHLE